MTVGGNFEGNNVLQRRKAEQLSETLEIALDKLFLVRYGKTTEAITTFPPASNNQEAKSGNWQGRIPPVTDTKMIVAWNSVMISGLARASVVFAETEYLDISYPQACPSLFTAWDWYRNSTLVRTTNEKINDFIDKYLPTVMFVQSSNLPEGSIGLVCQGLKCLAPAANVEQMWEQLQQSQGRGGKE